MAALDQAPARRIRETSGPTTLVLDGIPDGFLLQRSGATVIGIDPSSVAGFGADSDAWHKTGDSFGADATFGTEDNNSVIFHVNGVEWGRLTPHATAPWTGPRLLIGTTVNTLPGDEAITISRSIPDQLGMSIRNEDSVNIANAGYYLVDDTGAIGGFNILNSGWPNDGSNTGCYPHEVALLTAGADSNLVLGTTFPNNKIRFTGNNGGTSGLTAIELMTLQNDLVGDAVLLDLKAPASQIAQFKIKTAGSSGETGTGVYLLLENSDGKLAYHTLLESGTLDTFAGKNGYYTIATNAGVGLRFNVNGDNNSGMKIDTSQNVWVNGLFPLAGDGNGSLGTASFRWSDLYVVNAAHVGDLVMSDKKMGTKWTLREAKVKGEDKNALYAINGRNGKKFKLVMEAA